jgi:hypothetical protein
VMYGTSAQQQQRRRTRDSGYSHQTPPKTKLTVNEPITPEHILRLRQRACQEVISESRSDSSEGLDGKSKGSELFSSSARLSLRSSDRFFCFFRSDKTAPHHNGGRDYFHLDSSRWSEGWDRVSPMAIGSKSGGNFVV